jgi:serpin B
VGLIPLIGCSGEEDVSPEDENLEMSLEEETPKDLHGCAIIEKPANFTDNALSTANAKFGFKLLTELYNQKPGTNVFISPLGVSIALTMTYNGAGGETQRAMAKTLEIEGMELQAVNQANAQLREITKSTDPQIELAIANSIWLRDTFDETNPDFLDRNERFFGAEIASLDFDDPQTLETINRWVNTNTQGKITEILSKIEEHEVMFLINAIYFKGGWKGKFDPSKTQAGIFHLLDGSEKQLPMMSHICNYSYLEATGFRAIGIPYGEGRVSMYIFLPEPSSNLDEFLEDLNAENWKSWLSQFREELDLRLIMPRFKLEYQVLLNDALKALGMEIAFIPYVANLSGIAPLLFIEKVIHKTFLEVNEEGTEAAAVTLVGLPPASGPRPFVVNRPFFFTIHDNWTNTILFMGTVTEPL